MFMDWKGGDGDSYLLVQHTRIYYFDEKADRTSTYPDGIRAEFAMGGRVRFWRVGCPFDVAMMDNLFACSGLFDRLIDGERRRRREGKQKTEKGRSPKKGGFRQAGLFHDRGEARRRELKLSVCLSVCSFRVRLTIRRARKKERKKKRERTQKKKEEKPDPPLRPPPSSCLMN